MAILRLDLDELDALLSVLGDAVEHRGDADLAGVVRLVQRHVERIADRVASLPGGGW